MMDIKELKVDVHTHTIASGHAYGTIREMASAASGKGLSILGFSEHGPGIPGTCDPIYFHNLRAVPRCLYGVEILHGCEVNILSDGTLCLAKYLDLGRLDYAIAGIHTPCYENAGAEKNTDNVISCMKNERVFFISHPDDNHVPLQYERLVPAAKEYHVALELNNSSLLKPERRLGCVENYRRMLSLCQQYEVPILVSSDAHDPSAVGRFEKAAALLDETGFRKDLILNTDTERFKAFIGYSG